MEGLYRSLCTFARKNPLGDSFFIMENLNHMLRMKINNSKFESTFKQPGLLHYIYDKLAIEKNSYSYGYCFYLSN